MLQHDVANGDRISEHKMCTKFPQRVIDMNAWINCNNYTLTRYWSVDLDAASSSGYDADSIA